MAKSTPKVALVYDRVNTPHGGAEKVLLTLHQIYPQGPLYTAVYDPDSATWAKDFQVIPSFLNNLPGAAKYHRVLAPLMPLAFESFNLDKFDIIISITSAEAKGVITTAQQLHVCYLLTPTRYLYSHQTEYLDSLPPVPGLKAVTKVLLKQLEHWDKVAAHRPDVLIPISEKVKQRTQAYYQRQTEAVIYPPVELPLQSKLQKNNISDDFYLVLSRLVPYKRIDLAIQACEQLGKKLVVAGDGPDRQRLEKLSQQKSTVFLGAVSDTQAKSLLTQAQALIMPGEEDFGITALEAGAVGTPVILHAQSGAAEIIVHKKHGYHLPAARLSEVVKAIRYIQTPSFVRQRSAQNLLQYGRNTFVSVFKTNIDQLWQQHLNQLRKKE